MFLIKTRILDVRVFLLNVSENHDRRSSYFWWVSLWVWTWVLYKSLTPHPTLTSTPHKSKKRKRNGWLTTDILKVLDDKAEAFTKWLNNPGSQSESNYHKNYKHLQKIAKMMTEHRQEES